MVKPKNPDLLEGMIAILQDQLACLQAKIEMLEHPGAPPGDLVMTCPHCGEVIFDDTREEDDDIPAEGIDLVGGMKLVRRTDTEAY
jgi:hypothetical protein